MYVYVYIYICTLCILPMGLFKLYNPSISFSHTVDVCAVIIMFWRVTSGHLNGSTQKFERLFVAQSLSVQKVISHLNRDKMATEGLLLNVLSMIYNRLVRVDFLPFDSYVCMHVLLVPRVKF